MNEDLKELSRILKEIQLGTSADSIRMLLDNFALTITFGWGQAYYRCVYTLEEIELCNIDLKQALIDRVKRHYYKNPARLPE